MVENLIEILHTHFAFSSFRPGQKEAISSLLDGQHTLAVMPTGSGKSLIFQYTALQLKGLTLVISPLIALMKDQVDSLQRLKIPATYINSTLSLTEKNLRLKNLTRDKYRLVYIAPERLRSVHFLNTLKNKKISLLAVDEAHCISEWGHDFRPDYLNIAKFRNTIKNPLTVALTATATLQVQNDIIRLLGLGDSVDRIVTGFNRPNLYLNVLYTNGLPFKLRALKSLLSPPQTGSVIIYTGTRRDAEEVADFVREVINLPVEFYHAGLQSEKRTRIQDNFISGKTNIIVATNAFGMGIDRPDVRQVIHYSLPSSLEAYYQEVGRAGRDDLPARVTLLYDPKDRALQEFFIDSSKIVTADLRTIYNQIHNGQNRITIDDISYDTGLQLTQIRVGLAELEHANVLTHLGDDGSRMLFRKVNWDASAIVQVSRKNKERLRERKKQLEGIVSYAETNACRRETILNYFGEQELTEVDLCCDNCLVKIAKPKSSMNKVEITFSERIALAILDCIRRSKIKVGKRKLAQILSGSKAKDIHKYHHNKNMYYERLADLRQTDICMLIEQLIELGYIKVIGGKYPILSLTLLGENAISQRLAILLKMPKGVSKQSIQLKRAQRKAGGSMNYTAKLFTDGLDPEGIARERGLTKTTIYWHLTHLIEGGRISVEEVVQTEARKQIEEAIKKVKNVQNLPQIKAVLPKEISFGIIRCVIAGYKLKNPEIFVLPSPVNPTSTISMKRIVELGEARSPESVSELIAVLQSENGNYCRMAVSALGKIKDAKAVEPLLKLLEYESKPQVRQYTVKALGAIGDKRAIKSLQRIVNNEDEKYYTRNSAKIALQKLNRKVSQCNLCTPPDTSLRHTEYSPTQSDTIDDYLSRSHPRLLNGPWKNGWALDFYSRFTGGDWSRSIIGDLTYRLKYESDTSVLPILIERTLELFQAHPEMKKVDIIVPVPSTAERKIQPVQVYCEALSNMIKLPIQMIIIKNSQTKPQKGMKTMAQKRRNISGAFALNTKIQGKRILLVDDLFDSGATLEEITRLLLKGGATKINVLTLTCAINSNL